MTDLAEACRKANETGFEQGSLATVNIILAWLQRTGQNETAAHLLHDWDNNLMLPVKRDERPAVGDAAPTTAAPPVDERQQREVARSKGFTGNVCDQCGSMEMKISGHCEVCSSCGTTTGCS